MVDVAGELGVDAIGLNHLMFSTPDEVDETVRLTGATDRSAISTFVTADPGLDAARVRTQVDRLAAKCRERKIRFDMRPKVGPAIIDDYYTPGAALAGRCLYPFLYARVSFSGKVYFCPFIRIEVGDLTHQSLESSGRVTNMSRCGATCRTGAVSRLPEVLQGGASDRMPMKRHCSFFRGFMLK